MIKKLTLIAVIISFFLSVSGCMKPEDYRKQADSTAEDIIRQTGKSALGKEYGFGVERPSDILRRRLLKEQELQFFGKESLGSDALDKPKYWPEKDYPRSQPGGDPNIVIARDKPLQITLTDALMIGAKNSFGYQNQKESIFAAALSLDLEANNFRNIFSGQVRSFISSSNTSGTTTSQTSNSGDIGVSKTFENGTQITSSLAIDLANLLTGIDSPLPHWKKSMPAGVLRRTERSFSRGL